MDNPYAATAKQALAAAAEVEARMNDVPMDFADLDWEPFLVAMHGKDGETFYVVFDGNCEALVCMAGRRHGD